MTRLSDMRRSLRIDGRPEISVVVPIHDELANIEPLVAALDASLDGTGRSCEYVLVDDGSTDGSAALIDRVAAHHGHVVPVHLRRCFGQTAALAAGLEASRGDIIVFLDADLQNDPADIPSMLDRLDEGHDVVHGWRQSRQDVFWSRRLPSLVANWLIRRATGVKVRDLGCALRVMRREIAEELPLEGDMHRFIAVLADARGASACEQAVRHHPRQHGRSKYGLSRTLKVMVDLVVLLWVTRMAVPLVRLLVGAGLALLGCGVLAVPVGLLAGGSWLATLGGAIACLAMGLQLVAVGLMAATASSSWWRSRQLRPWSVRVVGDRAVQDDRRQAA